MPVFNLTASSKVGCVRTNNEDMVLVGDQLVRDGKTSMTVSTDIVDRLIVAVADGMGGHLSGEVASADTLENLRYYYGDLPVGLSPEKFMEHLHQWHSSIHSMVESKGRDDERLFKMGTTLVALACYDHKFYWLNCGDSRLYRLHDGVLQQLTTDHSLNNKYDLQGPTNLITNCIGGGCRDSFVDVVECSNQVQPGDVLMLCSDGLNDMVPDSQICDMLSLGYDAEHLCLAAEAAGGHDNVSVVVIRIE